MDTIEARVTLCNLMGFDYDPSEAHDEQTPLEKHQWQCYYHRAWKRGKGMKIQQETNSIGENEERGSYEKQIYCAKS